LSTEEQDDLSAVNSLQDLTGTAKEKPDVPLNHLLLDSAPNIGPLISRWELDKLKKLLKQKL
jgi:hypothetical protein